MQSPKLLVIGIDGGTFDLVAPWAKEGKLPSFARLMGQGSWGNLESCLPPITAAAWTSFMTGKHPGKHGLFDFIESQQGSYQMKYTSTHSRKGKTLWRLLSDAGLKVGTFNIPMTYPPEKINGFMISGMDAPDENSELTYPAPLREELKENLEGIKLDIRHLGHMRTDRHRDFTLDALEELEVYRTKLALYLMEKHPVDVFMVVFNATDQAQHHFWHYMDPNHPSYDAKCAERYGDAILRIYKKVDEGIGQILDHVSEDTSVMLMSDHGAGPIGDQELYLNRYLEKIGVLTYERQHRSMLSPSSLFSFGIKKIDAVLRSILSPDQKNRLAKLFPRARGKMESYLSFGSIDWSRTKAYACEISPSSPYIYINMEGKRPKGIVKSGKEYDELISFLMDHLQNLKDPDTGKPFIKKIYKKDELAQGQKNENIPDLALCWWDGKFTVKQSFPSKEGDPIISRRKGFVGGRDWSGTHRMNGMFLIKGKPFRQNIRSDNAKIVDVLPTIFHLLGLPIPDHLDGSVIEEAFTPAFLSSHPPVYQKVDKEEIGPEESFGGYSKEEEEKIKARLAALGYVE